MTLVSSRVSKPSLVKHRGAPLAPLIPHMRPAAAGRDYVLETLFFVAVHMAHLSRWAEDLIIYSSGLFKFVQCSDAYATGARPLPTWASWGTGAPLHHRCSGPNGRGCQGCMHLEP